MRQPTRARPSRRALTCTLALVLIACSGPPPTVSTPARHVASPSPAAAAADPKLVPLAIDAMRQREYPGSDLAIEQTLTPGRNSRRSVASYQSHGLKISV